MSDRHSKLAIFIFGFVASLLLYKSCNNDEVISTTKTKTVNIKKITDSIKEVLIKKITPIYRDKVITETVYIKNDSINNTINNDANGKNINSYDVLLKSNNSTANLKINVLGTLKDVTGVINYPEVTNTEIITKKIAVSSNYIFLKSNIDRPLNNFDLGYIRTFKSKFLIIGSITYDQQLNAINQSPISLNVGIGIKF